MESKLSSLNLPAASSKEIIKNIYGNIQGTHKSEGLVHAPDVEIFNALLSSLEKKWKKINTHFFEWFESHVALYMSKTMLTDIRVRNGIHNEFSTNQSESLNAVIKRKVKGFLQCSSFCLFHFQGKN